MEHATRHVSEEARNRVSAIMAVLYFAHPRSAHCVSSDLRAIHGFEISPESVESDMDTLSAAGLVRVAVDGATLTAKGLASVLCPFGVVVAVS
ncbi:hypothetical protein [Thauera sp.]|uniref:hypothetical protein n=1 Tax=Thauera sp. TaxID=1905334 RepID=UPI002C5AD0C9|nr:hypothetical protein [Thauera sp.]HRP26515.1 hypothetical protein [Thauera sp.]